MRKKFLPIGLALALAISFGGYWYLDYFNTNTSLATGQKVQFTVTPIDFSAPCGFALNRVIPHVSAHLRSCSEKRDSVKPFLPTVK